MTNPPTETPAVPDPLPPYNEMDPTARVALRQQAYQTLLAQLPEGLEPLLILRSLHPTEIHVYSPIQGEEAIHLLAKILASVISGQLQRFPDYDPTAVLGKLLVNSLPSGWEFALVTRDAQGGLTLGNSPEHTAAALLRQTLHKMGEPERSPGGLLWPNRPSDS